MSTNVSRTGPVGLVLPALLAVLIAAGTAQAQQAITTADALKLFRTYCLKPLGDHGRTNAAMAKAPGFRVTDTSGAGGVSERILVQNGSVDMSNLRLGAESTCFVGYTPAEPRPDAQAQAAAAIAAALGLAGDAVQRKGKELRIRTKSATVKIVANRVYPISIGVTSPYR